MGKAAAGDSAVPRAQPGQLPHLGRFLPALVRLGERLSESLFSGGAFA